MDANDSTPSASANADEDPWAIFGTPTTTSTTTTSSGVDDLWLMFDDLKTPSQPTQGTDFLQPSNTPITTNPILDLYKSDAPSPRPTSPAINTSDISQPGTSNLSSTTADVEDRKNTRVEHQNDNQNDDDFGGFDQHSSGKVVVDTHHGIDGDFGTAQGDDLPQDEHLNQPSSDMVDDIPHHDDSDTFGDFGEAHIDDDTPHSIKHAADTDRAQDSTSFDEPSQTMTSMTSTEDNDDDFGAFEEPTPSNDKDNDDDFGAFEEPTSSNDKDNDVDFGAFEEPTSSNDKDNDDDFGAFESVNDEHEQSAHFDTSDEQHFPSSTANENGDDGFGAFDSTQNNHQEDSVQENDARGDEFEAFEHNVPLPTTDKTESKNVQAAESLPNEELKVSIPDARPSSDPDTISSDMISEIGQADEEFGAFDSTHEELHDISSEATRQNDDDFSAFEDTQQHNVEQDNDNFGACNEEDQHISLENVAHVVEQPISSENVPENDDDGFGAFEDDKQQISSEIVAGNDDDFGAFEDDQQQNSSQQPISSENVALDDDDLRAFEDDEKPISFENNEFGAFEEDQQQMPSENVVQNDDDFGAFEDDQRPISAQQQISSENMAQNDDAFGAFEDEQQQMSSENVAENIALSSEKDDDDFGGFDATAHEHYVSDNVTSHDTTTLQEPLATDSDIAQADEFDDFDGGGGGEDDDEFGDFGDFGGGTANDDDFGDFDSANFGQEEADDAFIEGGDWNAFDAPSTTEAPPSVESMDEDSQVPSTAVLEKAHSTEILDIPHLDTKQWTQRSDGPQLTQQVGTLVDSIFPDQTSNRQQDASTVRALNQRIQPTSDSDRKTAQLWGHLTDTCPPPRIFKFSKSQARSIMLRSLDIEESKIPDTPPQRTNQPRVSRKNMSSAPAGLSDSPSLTAGDFVPEMSSPVVLSAVPARVVLSSSASGSKLSLDRTRSDTEDALDGSQGTLKLDTAVDTLDFAQEMSLPAPSEISGSLKELEGIDFDMTTMQDPPSTTLNRIASLPDAADLLEEHTDGLTSAARRYVALFPDLSFMLSRTLVPMASKA